MSLTRKMLKAMGIEDDAIEQIIEAHTETFDAIKSERDRYKAELSESNGLRDELERTKKQLESALDTTEYDTLKSEYKKQGEELDALRKSNEALRVEYDGYKEKVSTMEMERDKREAYRALLDEAGVSPKYVGKVLRVTDMGSFELGEDGAVKDAESIINGIKDEWGEFIPTTNTEGSNPATPPDGVNTNGVSERARGIIERYYESKYGKTSEE